MAYTEIQRRGKTKYFYLAQTVRIDSHFKKVRVFLGVNVSQNALKDEIKRKEEILRAKISVIEKAEKESFTLKIGFSKKILSKKQLDKIEKLKKRYHKRTKFADKDILKKVRESFIIKYTYDTNSAEGNTITLKETELIVTKGIVPKAHSLREIHEIENTVKAYEYIEQYNGRLGHKLILHVHNLVTQNTLTNKKNEGKYRIKGQNVAMHGSKHFPPKGGRQIKKLVGNLIDEYYNSKLSIVESTILFHSAFIAIHPLIDGNGRVSRLLFNWMLLMEGLPPIDFPSENHIEFTDLLEASRDGDSIPLASYLLERIMHSSMNI